MFDIFMLSLFNQVFVIFGRIMSKFFLFLMGLVTFIRNPLFNVLLVDYWVPPLLEFSDEYLKGIYSL
jgi:hypothetical protein